MLPELVGAAPLSAKAQDLIEADILSGDLAPGSRLLETQLASRFRISRGPLCEALKSLVVEGFVAIHPGRGAFVANSMAPDVATNEVFYGCIPFVFMEQFIVGLLIAFPQIALFAVGG